MMYELEPIYDPHKSFYGKAYVHHVDDNKWDLYSYNTKVCTIDLYHPPCVFIYSNTLWDSVTTLRHIREFLHQYCEDVTMFSKNYLKRYLV